MASSHSRHMVGVMRRILKSGCLVRFGLLRRCGRNVSPNLRVRIRIDLQHRQAADHFRLGGQLLDEGGGHIRIRRILREVLKQVLEGSLLRRRHNRRRTCRRLNGHDQYWRRLPGAAVCPSPGGNLPTKAPVARTSPRASERTIVPSVATKTQCSALWPAWSRPGKPHLSTYRGVNRALISANETARPRLRNVPPSAISVAASTKPVHAAAGQRPADANPPDAQPLKFSNGGEIAPDQNVHRFRCDGTDHRRDITRSAYPRRVQALRASLRIRGQAADRLRKVWPPDDEALRTGGQEHTGPCSVDGLASSSNALHRQ